MSAPSLSVQALGFGHRRPLFSPLSIDCRPGEVWAVLGANGCGKSTLFATISGALKPLAGQVSAGDGISVVPQSFRPAFGWRVQEVVLMGRARRVSLFGQPSAARCGAPQRWRSSASPTWLSAPLTGSPAASSSWS